MMLDLLNHEEINFEIKNAFVHLFTNLWVDLPQYQKLNVDLNIVEWDKLRDMYSFPIVDIEDVYKFKPVRYYIS